MEVCRLIIDPPANGAWNMAVDQALLETANRTGQMTLRFYQWSEPTLSLGYFQNHHDREKHPPSINCPMVRRKTGGGAIMHDHELTYSLSIPSQNRWSRKNTELYSTLHQIIIDLLAEYEIQSHLHKDVASTAAPRISPNVDHSAFMCFNRRSDGDIVLGGHKVVGSAQRRLKNALLQHGSILMDNSQMAPDLKGIRDLSNFCLNVGETIEKICKDVTKRLQLVLNHEKLGNLENSAVESAFESTFNSKEWNFRR
ncbi:MAG: biotin/lipoate A/B protein ligase family protein [Mariniblastus sp.]